MNPTETIKLDVSRIEYNSSKKEIRGKTALTKDRSTNSK